MSRSVRELIVLPKVGRRVKDVPKKLGHAQLNVHARADDGTRFAVFVRVLLELPESFSLGLVVIGEAGSTLLLRVNGDHGDHGNEDGDVFDGPHIHEPTAAQAAAPPAPGTKPRFAVRLDAATAPSLPAYWPLFKQMISLSVSQEVDRAIGGIYRKAAQMVISDGDDDDSTDDAGGPDRGAQGET